MPLAVGEQRMAGGIDRGLQAQGRERVLQGPAAAPVHMHVAAGHTGQPAGGGERRQIGQARGIVGTAVQFDGEPGAAGKARREPAPVVDAGRRAGDPQRQAVGHGPAAPALRGIEIARVSR